MEFKFETVVLVFFTFVCSLGIYMSCMTIMASSNVNSCYIEQDYNKTYYLQGNIAWRPDITISKKDTIEDITYDANKLHCKLWSESK